MRLKLDYSIDMSEGVIGMKLIAEDVKDCIQLRKVQEHFPFLEIKTELWELYGYIKKGPIMSDSLKKMIRGEWEPKEIPKNDQ